MLIISTSKKLSILVKNLTSLDLRYELNFFNHFYQSTRIICIR